MYINIIGTVKTDKQISKRNKSNILFLRVKSILALQSNIKAAIKSNPRLKHFFYIFIQFYLKT